MASVAGPKPRTRPATRRRQGQVVGAAGVGLAALLPAVLWHDVVADVARLRTVDPTFVVGWAPWTLMIVGLLCAIPIVAEHLRDREHRFHRPGTGAWAGWGVTLYLLGFALATQVAQIHGKYS